MNALYHQTKHWVLFIITVGIPFVAYFVWLFSFFSQITFYDNYEPEFEEINQMFSGIATFVMIAFIAQLIYYGWMWSAGVGLQKYIPEELRMKTGFFKVTILYPVFFGLVYMAFFVWIWSTGFENLDDLDPVIWILPYFLLLIPLGLFAVFCSFYSFWFAGKTVKTMELQREVKFSDFTGEFFLFWFYFVGYWIIQPKINKVTSEGS